MPDTNRTGDARQLPLVIETLPEAVHALAMQTGGWKALACVMRAELADDPDTAGRWLSDALNPDRREVLHADHLRRALRYGRERGCHVLMLWLCDDLSYQQPDPVAAKSPRQQLAEKMRRIADEFQATVVEVDRLEQLDAIHQVRELRAAK